MQTVTLLTNISRISSYTIADILEAKDRRKSGPTAPPEGLYLKDVFYR